MKEVIVTITNLTIIHKLLYLYYHFDQLHFIKWSERSQKRLGQQEL